MSEFEIQFDLRGSLIVKADNYEEAQRLALKKLEQYQQSITLHFQKKVELTIDDVEAVS